MSPSPSAPSAEIPIEPPLLSCVELHKHYGPVQALRGVNLDLWPGQLVALVGDNGAGKSTLVKTLAGVIRPTHGSIKVDGVDASLTSPTAARAHGIETVYQDLGLCENLSVTENLFLGRELVRSFGPFKVLRRREMTRQAADHMSRLARNVPSPRAQVNALSGGQRQAIALARCRLWHQRFVMLDEPTAALGVQETKNSIDTIRQLHATGAAVLLISHDIPLVMELSSRVVVLRRGVKVADVPTSGVTEHDVVAMITGAYSSEEPNVSMASSDDQISETPDRRLT